MSSHLDRIQDWEELAKESNWCVAALAKRSGVSVRTLERWFFENLGKTPKAWLVEKRQKRATELLREGCLVKEAAVRLGFHYPHHFSREFKAYWGFCPSTEVISHKLMTVHRNAW